MRKPVESNTTCTCPNCVFDPEPNRCIECNTVEGQPHEKGCSDEICAKCRHHVSCHCECTDEERGALPRIPYIHYALMCFRCGDIYPDFFMVPDEEWERYIDPHHQHEIICRTCYAWVKHLIDTQGQPEAMELPLPELLDMTDPEEKPADENLSN